MKIGLAHKRLDLDGGTERDFYKTAEGLRDLGHEVHLFCSEFRVDPPAQTFRHVVPTMAFGRTARLWSFARAAPRLIEAEKCDVGVGFGRMVAQDVVRSGGGTHAGFLESLGAEGGRGRRLWQTFSCYHQSVIALERVQFTCRAVKRILAVSEEVKRDIVKHYGVRPEQIVVLYNGVDDARFRPRHSDEVRLSVRREWKIPPDAAVVLFVGSGFRRKGLDRLVPLWNRPSLQQSYLLIVGDDARMARYRERARQVSPDRIIFAGRQSSVERYYAAADVLVLPAIQEAFGNVVLEALSCGIPVVVSRRAGAAEILAGKLAAGVLENSEDPLELENRVADALALSRDPACPGEARQVAERYSWKNHFHRLEAVLKDVHREKRIRSM
ncbi:MAG TPA: glycosyltransferase family 4 protein [Candidatus Binatia bacterium]|jgi:UDP-glucose:(heptosyl)LPS alpha-1,3-glucosyltransferase